MNSKKTIFLVFVILVVTNLFTFGATRLVTGSAMVNEKMAGIIGAEEEGMEFSLIEEVYNILLNDYYEELDEEELVEGAIEGMLESLDDPETGYMTPTDLENMMIQTEGSYSGIGIEVFQEGDYIRVLAPISGSPGEEAGLQSGDKIVEVEGENVVGSELNEVVDMIRGEEGTEVMLTVERELSPDEREEFTIVREEIEMSSVEFEVLNNDLGYLEINSFTRTTSDELENALNSLQENNVQGLILDLRDNPGGLLDAAIEVGQQLVPEGPIVHKMGREEKLETYYSEGRVSDLPMVVLVNEVSASASEILAGALQDTGAAKVIGSKTFGKASVQNVARLSDGGALRYTMGSYQTPDKRDLHETGLTPDIEVEMQQLRQLGEEPITENLEPGDESDMVKTLQEILGLLGYYDGEINGEFDSTTEEAVKDFQTETGISADGVVTDYVMIQIQEELEKYQEKHDDVLDKGLEVLRGKVEE